MSGDRFTIFQNELRPSLRDQLLVDGEPLSLLPGDTVNLRAHLSGEDPDVLLINSAAVIEDPGLGLVRYDWQAGDTATTGKLIAWWYIVASGNPQSSPAFVIPILDQAAIDPGVGVYASVLDVKALAGFLSDAWTPTSSTDEGDIATFLAMTSGEIDAVLVSLGAALPLEPLGAPALSLRSLTADGALVRALGATWPYNAPAGVTELRNDARSRYTYGLSELLNGTHPAASAIASAAGGSSAGGSLWTDTPEYGRWGYYPDLIDRNPALAPSVHKGQGF